MRKQSKSWKGLGKKGERGEKRLGMSQNWTLTKLVTDCLNSELPSSEEFWKFVTLEFLGMFG